jgi:hypothetical protein
MRRDQLLLNEVGRNAQRDNQQLAHSEPLKTDIDGARHLDGSP